MEKILISACLLGANVRYDGKSKLLRHPQLALWQQQGRVIPVCPEVSGGLTIPRVPAEVSPTSGRVLTQAGTDVTEPFYHGAQHALTLCQNHHIRFALLKESSPSCGSNTIYDGHFSQQKIAGAGVTSQLLRANHIKVFSEENIEELIAELAMTE